MRLLASSLLDAAARRSGSGVSWTRGAPMTTSTPGRSSQVAARVLERVRAVADPRAAVEAFGSSIYAPAHADDVDVLVCDDDPGRLATALGLAQIPTLPPRLVGEIDGTRVDVSVVTGDGEIAQRMRSGPRDAAM